MMKRIQRMKRMMKRMKRMTRTGDPNPVAPIGLKTKPT